MSKGHAATKQKPAASRPGPSGRCGRPSVGGHRSQGLRRQAAAGKAVRPGRPDRAVPSRRKSGEGYGVQECRGDQGQGQREGGPREEKDAARRRPDSPLPLLDLSDAAVKKMIKQAKKRGYVTHEQLNAVLPSEEVTSDQIEDIYAMLNEMGINVVEQEEGADDEEAKPADEAEDDDDSDGELVEAKPKALATAEKKEPSERTDDPVRMYLREMGSVELLSREGEIAIAKRIEAGREAMIAGLCESPLTFQAIIIWRDELNDGKVFLRDIIDLEATYAGPDAKNSMATAERPAIGPTASRSRRAAAGAPPPARRRGAPQAAAPPSAPPPPRRSSRAGDAAATARRGEGGEQPPRRRRLRRRRHGEFAVARRDRGRAQAQGGRDLRQDRRRLQAAAPPAGPGHPAPAQERRAVAGAGAQVQEAQGRDHRRGEVAAAQPGAHRRAGRAALRHQQAARRLRGPADAARRKLRRRRARTSCKNYQGSELDPRWLNRVSKLSAKGWKNLVAKDKDKHQGDPRATSTRSPARPGSRSASSARSCTWCRRASARRARPRRRWWRRTCASSSRSPRNTPTAACSSST